MLVSERIRIFLDYLQFQKKYSPHTISNYKSDIETFIDFIKIQYECTALEEVTSIMVRDWLAQFKINAYSPASILRKKSSVHTLFRYLLRQNVIIKDPTASLPIIKQTKRLATYASEKDMQKLFNHINFEENYNGSLHFIILHLLYLTGIRVSELINCKSKDIDVSNRQLKVLGKGNKERLIPISSQTTYFIEQYQLAKKQHLAEASFSETHLLLSPKGKPLSRQQAYTICKKHLSQATTLNKKSPHVLRHSFATHLLNKNAEINSIKELLGHSSLAATQIYTHSDMNKLKKVYKKSHPRDK